MKKSIQDFLEFKGELITYIAKDDQYWISLPSLCKALNIDESRSYKNAKKDPIIGPALAVQPVQVPGKAGFQRRNVTCIPEFLVYGWIFSIKSESQDLLDYKKECYKILYNYFHGSIGNRIKVLKEQYELEKQIAKLEIQLKEDEQLKKLESLKNRRKQVKSALTQLDNKVIKAQQELWESN